MDLERYEQLLKENQRLKNMISIREQYGNEKIEITFDKEIVYGLAEEKLKQSRLNDAYKMLPFDETFAPHMTIGTK